MRRDPPCCLLVGRFSRPPSHLLRGEFRKALLPALGVDHYSISPAVLARHQPLLPITALDLCCGAFEKTVFSTRGFAGAEEARAHPFLGEKSSQLHPFSGGPACGLSWWVRWIRPRRERLEVAGTWVKVEDPMSIGFWTSQDATQSERFHGWFLWKYFSGHGAYFVFMSSHFFTILSSSTLVGGGASLFHELQNTGCPSFTRNVSFEVPGQLNMVAKGLTIQMANKADHAAHMRGFPFL